MDTENLKVSSSPTYRDSPPPPATLGLHPGHCVHAGDSGATIQALLQQAALVPPTQHRQCSICGHIVPTGNGVHTVRRIGGLMYMKLSGLFHYLWFHFSMELLCTLMYLLCTIHPMCCGNKCLSCFFQKAKHDVLKANLLPLVNGELSNKITVGC